MDDVDGAPNDTAGVALLSVCETSCSGTGLTTESLGRQHAPAPPLAIAEANKVLDAMKDPVGGIFPPQRLPYNPGGKMWNEAENASSDFQVWTFAEDVSGVASVKLNWRADLDGLNPIGETDNEVYARNAAKVGAWNEVAMSGDWWPGTKGPNVPDPTKRAKRYTATVAGQNNVLIGITWRRWIPRNATRSDIPCLGRGQHNVPQPSVEFDRRQMAARWSRQVQENRSLGSSQVYIHIGRNGWQDVVARSYDRFRRRRTYVYVTPTNKEINVCFNDGGGHLGQRRN